MRPGPEVTPYSVLGERLVHGRMEAAGIIPNLKQAEEEFQKLCKTLNVDPQQVEKLGPEQLTKTFPNLQPQQLTELRDRRIRVLDARSYHDRISLLTPLGEALDALHLLCTQHAVHVESTLRMSDAQLTKRFPGDEPLVKRFRGAIQAVEKARAAVLASPLFADLQTRNAALEKFCKTLDLDPQAVRTMSPLQIAALRTGGDAPRDLTATERRQLRDHRDTLAHEWATAEDTALHRYRFQAAEQALDTFCRGRGLTLNAVTLATPEELQKILKGLKNEEQRVELRALLERYVQTRMLRLQTMFSLRLDDRLIPREQLRIEGQQNQKTRAECQRLLTGLNERTFMLEYQMAMVNQYLMTAQLYSRLRYDRNSPLHGLVLNDNAPLRDLENRVREGCEKLQELSPKLSLLRRLSYVQGMVELQRQMGLANHPDHALLLAEVQRMRAQLPSHRVTVRNQESYRFGDARLSRDMTEGELLLELQNSEGMLRSIVNERVRIPINDLIPAQGDGPENSNRRFLRDWLLRIFRTRPGGDADTVEFNPVQGLHTMMLTQSRTTLVSRLTGGRALNTDDLVNLAQVELGITNSSLGYLWFVMGQHRQFLRLSARRGQVGQRVSGLPPNTNSFLPQGQRDVIGGAPQLDEKIRKEINNSFSLHSEQLNGYMANVQLHVAGEIDILDRVSDGLRRHSQLTLAGAQARAGNVLFPYENPANIFEWRTSGEGAGYRAVLPEAWQKSLKSAKQLQPLLKLHEEHTKNVQQLSQIVEGYRNGQNGRRGLNQVHKEISGIMKQIQELQKANPPAANNLPLPGAEKIEKQLDALLDQLDLKIDEAEDLDMSMRIELRDNVQFFAQRARLHDAAAQLPNPWQMWTTGYAFSGGPWVALIIGTAFTVWWRRRGGDTHIHNNTTIHNSTTIVNPPPDQPRNSQPTPEERAAQERRTRVTEIHGSPLVQHFSSVVIEHNGQHYRYVFVTEGNNQGVRMQLASDHPTNPTGWTILYTTDGTVMHGGTGTPPAGAEAVGQGHVTGEIHNNRAAITRPQAFSRLSQPRVAPLPAPPPANPGALPSSTGAERGGHVSATVLAHYSEHLRPVVTEIHGQTVERLTTVELERMRQGTVEERLAAERYTELHEQHRTQTSTHAFTFQDPLHMTGEHSTRRVRSWTERLARRR